MLRPTNTAMSPPGGWSVIIPGAGPEIQSYNFADFLKQAFQRLQANGMDQHGWKDMILDMACRQRPDIPSEDSDANERAMTGDDVWRFLRSIWTAREEGAQAVSEELQNKRVDVCLACPKIGHITCFIGCGSLSETLSKLLLGRKVPRLPEIHKMSCMACGCSAEVKTMWPMDVIKAVDEKHGTKPDYAPGCWILTEQAESQPNMEPKPAPSLSAQPPPFAS